MVGTVLFSRVYLGPSQGGGGFIICMIKHADDRYIFHRSN